MRRSRRFQRLSLQQSLRFWLMAAPCRTKTCRSCCTERRSLSIPELELALARELSWELVARQVLALYRGLAPNSNNRGLATRA
jgi:hypothetical protein